MVTDILQLHLISDRELPLGKKIAQLSHAVCALILGSFDFQANGWKAQDAEARFAALGMAGGYPLSAVVIPTPLTDMPERATISIVDQGHTVFDGVPTKTVALVVPEDLVSALQYSENPYTPASTNVRLVQVWHKAEVKARNKADPDALILEAVQRNAAHTIRVLCAMRDGELSMLQRDALLQWVSGSFAKISLVGDLTKVPKEFARYYTLARPAAVLDPVCLVLGPAFREELDEVTHDFRLL